MEASEALGQAETAEPAQETAEQAGPDYGEQLNERFTELQDGLYERLGQFQQQQQQQAQPEQPQYEDPYAGYDQYETDPNAELTPQSVAQIAQQAAKQAADQVRQEHMIERRDQEYAQLEDEYPELRDTKTAQPIIARAQHLAQSMGLPVDNPRSLPGELLETVLIAERATKAAGQETPAGANPQVALEGGAGTTPPEPTEDPWERITARGPTNPF